MNYANRVKETTTSTSTTSIALGGAVQGSRTFATGFSVGTTLIPVCVEAETGEWEIGVYTLSNSNVLTRAYIVESSNNNQAVTFPAGSKEVYCTPIANLFQAGLTNQDDVGFDIILTIGQSNAAGRGAINTSMDIGDNRVWQYGGKSGETLYQKIFVGNDPLHNFEGINTGNMSLMTVACKTYAQIIPSNRRILMVPCASGGTPLFSGSANWSVGGNLYLNAISQANAAIAAALLQYPNSRFVGCLWHQGESDAVAGVSQANYQNALVNAIAGYRANITGAANSWFVIGGMVPEAISGNPSGYNPIVAAHQAVAAATDRCTYIAGPSGYTGDNLHYNADGCRIMGVRMATGIQTASRYSAVPVPASAITMSGPSSGPVSIASSNFTIAIAPVGGIVTGTVVATPSDGGAGGTFTPTTRSLTTASPSATFTYTPSAVEGVKTISLTNDGSLSNPANISYTATPAATVPAQMAAPVATAGDTTASVVMVAPSDGGSPITGYTVTSSPGGGVDSNAGTTGLTHTMTGLTNGVAYTFTAVATNAIGSSTPSPASNSVTPATADLRARAGFTNLTEGGSAGAWTYTGTGGASFDATGAVFNKGRAASALSAFSLVRQAHTNVSTDKFCIAVISGTSPLALASRVFTFLHGSDGVYTGFAAGSPITANGPNAGTVAAVGDIMQVRFASATSLACEVSKDGGSSWLLIHTQTTGIPSTALNFQLQLFGTGRAGAFVGTNVVGN